MNIKLFKAVARTIRTAGKLYYNMGVDFAKAVEKTVAECIDLYFWNYYTDMPTVDYDQFSLFVANTLRKEVYD